MGKVASFPHFNSSIFHNSQIHSPLRTRILSPGLSDIGNEVPMLSLSSVSSPLRAPVGILEMADEMKTLVSVRVMHAQMIKFSHTLDWDYGRKTLITWYLELADFISAAKVFFLCYSRDFAFWNSFLEEFKCYGGNPFEILEVFGELQCEGIRFDSKVLIVVLKLCAVLKDFWLGVEVHGCLIKRGLDLDYYSKCALINFYGSCGEVETANHIFAKMPVREYILWNEVIMVNLRNKKWIESLELFQAMQFTFAKANSNTVVKVLQACGKVGALIEGKQIHGHVLRCDLASNLLICNSLISMYSKNKRLELARRVFNSMKYRNSSSWNSIISAYAALGYWDEAWSLFHEMESSNIKPETITWNCLLSGHSLHGFYKEAVNAFRRMLDFGLKPNSSSVTSVLQAVVELRLFSLGKEIHGYVVRNNLHSEVYAATSLVDMYVKGDCIESAERVFNMTKCRNLYTWNSLLSGYSFKGLFEDAERLLNEMQKEGHIPDLVTWNALVSGYSRCGRSAEALAVIDRIRASGLIPNVVSWTALISGCSQNERYWEALSFFIQMQEDAVNANEATTCSLLQACAGLSLLQTGKEIHCLCLRKGFIEDVQVATAVIDMYNKSGDSKAAGKVFRCIPGKTVATWNCMMMGYSNYGLGRQAIMHFDEMLESGCQPDSVTFTALLSACKNSGFIEEGWKFFDDMSTKYSIIPTIEHYSCMVDLLGRAGYLDEAWDFIQTMPLEPDASIWGALLASCRIHGNIELAVIASKYLFNLEPLNSANYLMLMSLYAFSNRWEEVEHLKDLMLVRSIKPRTVCSWIHIDQIIHLFSTEEKPHPELGQIYFELYQLVSEMKKLGYTPVTSCVYQNIEPAEKEKVLLSHTEKLAITYGLIKMKHSEPVRVVKNTRTCEDCHTAAKVITLARNREIFLRDGVRLHHFREGKCSCNDYW